MILSYTKEELLKILQEHHRISNNPIKIGYKFCEIRDIELHDAFVDLLFKKDDEDD